MQRALLLILLSVALGSAFTKKDPRRRKIELLRRRALASRDYIIRMNLSDYNKYALSGPRPYDLVILFTADKCRLCSSVEQEYAALASFYKARKTHFATKVANGQVKRPVFFAIVRNGPGTSKIFRDLDFVSLPNMLVSTPRETSFNDKIEKKMYQRKYLWEIQSSDGTITAAKLINWLNVRTGRDIPYQESIWTFLYVFAIAAALLYAFYMVYTRLKWLVLHRTLWIIVYYIITFIGLSGTVYNILNGAQLYGLKRGSRGNDKIEFVAAGSRKQYILEGWTMAFCLLAPSLLLILFLNLHKFKLNWFCRKITYVFIAWAIFFFIGTVENVFRSKNAYQPHFWPPAHYMKGPLASDQGKYI